MADDGVCDGSGLGEGFPGQCSLLNLLGQFVADSFKLTEYLRVKNTNDNSKRSFISHLGCFRVEDFFCRKESLHVGDQEQDSGVVQSRQFIMQF